MAEGLGSSFFNLIKGEGGFHREGTACRAAASQSIAGQPGPLQSATSQFTAGFQARRLPRSRPTLWLAIPEQELIRRLRGGSSPRVPFTDGGCTPARRGRSVTERLRAIRLGFHCCNIVIAARVAGAAIAAIPLAGPPHNNPCSVHSSRYRPRGDRAWCSRHVARSAAGCARPSGTAGTQSERSGPVDVEQMLSPGGMSSTLKIMLLLTVISLAPSILIMTTCFMRFVIVLSLLGRRWARSRFRPTILVVVVPVPHVSGDVARLARGVRKRDPPLLNPPPAKSQSAWKRHSTKRPVRCADS